MKYEALKKEYYAVYEKEPRHQNEKNGVILAPYKTKEEAEQARVKYGYGDDNYYVDKYGYGGPSICTHITTTM
jgi:hypothetical protein